jgi:protein involved in polysaccharide export with SLBB domain
MLAKQSPLSCWHAIALGLVATLTAGCQLTRPHHAANEQLSAAIAAETPRELQKSFIPPYRIEPPDILVIEAVNIAPRAPYRLKTSDVLDIQASGTFQDAPIQGPRPIQIGGMVDLGMPYGSVSVAGLTLDEARHAVTAKLREQLREPQVSLSLAHVGSLQQIQGEHLVKPDGTVRLGSYGSVLIVGMTLDEAEAAIEMHLSQFLDHPDIAVDVYAFNSKTYYVILQGGGHGDQLYRFPYTGNETVLDALSQVGGLSHVSSKRIWVARPGPNWAGGDKVLPVDYDSIARYGEIGTNYQLFPGDRLYIEEDKYVALDTQLGKVLAPFERVMGFTLLGVETATRLSGRVLQGGGNPRGNF